MATKIIYANGLKFAGERNIIENESPDFLKKMEIAKRNYTWHRRIGYAVFYSCVFAISITFLTSLLFNYDKSKAWIIPLLFCGLLPACAGIFQEVFFGFRVWLRAMFTLPVAYIALGLAIPSLLVKNGTLSSIIVIFIIIGWIMILLRWFDAKRSLTLVSAAIEDYHEGKIYTFIDYNDEGRKYTLEIFPNSKLIYKLQNRLARKWEAADVKEIANNNPGEFLAPWYYAPIDNPPTDIIFYQRSMSSSEVDELVEIRKTFLRKSWISILPSIHCCPTVESHIASLI